MNATHHGPCPTCGKPHPGAPYSCRACIDAIPDPFEGEDGEDYTNRDFDHEAAMDEDFFS